MQDQFRVGALTIAVAALMACASKGSITANGPNHAVGGDAGVGINNQLPPEAVCPPDPDCFAGTNCLIECPNFWECEAHASGAGKRCTSPGPDLPGDGNWTCDEAPGVITCTGQTFPSDGGGGTWNCVQMGDLVVCTQTNPTYPDEPNVAPWNCYFASGQRICEDSGVPGSGGGSGVPGGPGGPGGPGDDGSGSGADGGVPGHGGPGTGSGPDGGTGPYGDGQGEYGCTCVPGQTRFCHVNDTIMSCKWGQAVCAPDGTWGECTPAPDSVIPSECRRNMVTVVGPGTEEVFVGYDAECCVRMGFCCDNQDFDYSLLDPTQPAHASVGNCDLVCAP